VTLRVRRMSPGKPGWRQTARARQWWHIGWDRLYLSIPKPGNPGCVWSARVGPWFAYGFRRRRPAELL